MDNELTCRRMEVFSAEYMEKLFYFCLKKTGNADEAEDLASDISLNILSALRRGTVPTHFSAWVWRIARNRYAFWVEQKRRRVAMVTGTDLSKMEYPDACVFEDEYLHAEQLRLMRRELSFTAKEYRELLVAYYLDGHKIGEIAAALRLPEGTVKSRLSRSRKILKEGMNMAREFGARSYKPEEIDFVASGSQPSDLPWSAVQRQIPKNILLEANNNPSTIEELSVELGIAAPYMEEEVRLLTDATLLKKVGDRVVTNFFIANRDCQLAIYNAERKDSKERSRRIDQIVADNLPEIKALGIQPASMSDADLKWLIISRAVDALLGSATRPDIWDIFKRPDGGSWGFVGMEKQNVIAEETSSGQDGMGDGKTSMFWWYYYSGTPLYNRTSPDMNETLLLADLIRRKRPLSSLTAPEKVLWDKLDGRFVHADKDGNIISDVSVFLPGVIKKFYEILEKHPLYLQAAKEITALFGSIRGILQRFSNPALYEQLDYYASMFLYNIHMMVIHDELDAGRLCLPEKPETSTAAMYLNILK